MSQFAKNYSRGTPPRNGRLCFALDTRSTARDRVAGYVSQESADWFECEAPLTTRHHLHLSVFGHFQNTFKMDDSPRSCASYYYNILHFGTGRAPYFQNRLAGSTGRPGRNAGRFLQAAQNSLEALKVRRLGPQEEKPRFGVTSPPALMQQNR